MIITVDTAEQKSPVLFEQWAECYPKKAKGIEVKVESLDYGDWAGNGKVIEFKYNNDLIDSLYSGRLEEELRYMLEQSPSWNRYLVVCGEFEPSVYDHAVTLAQQYFTMIRRRSVGVDAVDLMVSLLGSPPVVCDISLPILDRKMERSLVGALCYAVKGLSMECSAEIVGWRKTFEDLVEDLSAEKVQKVIFDFYGKEMQSLTDKVCKAIWRDING